MIRLRTLGATGLSVEGKRELSGLLRQPKRFALLVYLALARPRGFHRRETLLALFWPELDDSRARAALRQALYFLRKRVPESLLENRGDEEVAVVREALWCDAVAFEEALEEEDPARALELYQGDLLDGFHVPDASPRFGYWLDEERERLRGRAVEAARLACEGAERGGDEDGARRYAARAVALAPMDEDAIRAQMELLDRLNDRAGALLAFESWAQRFREELEVEPSPETLAVVDALRVSDRPPSGAPRAPSSAPPPARAEVGANPMAGASSSAGPLLPLSAASAPARARRRRLWRWGAAGAVALALILTFALLRPSSTADGEGDGGEAVAVRLAVLPFAYQGGPEDAYLSEGLLYLFGVALEGGDVLTIAPHAVLQHVETPVIRSHDPARAAELASRVGADHYLVGNAVESDGQLHLSASLHRTDTREAVGQAAGSGATSELFPLVDRLAAELLITYRGAASRVTRVAAVTTPSLPALKAFLAGEGRLREGRFDAAVAAFQEAVLQDPTFALAHYRMSLAASWAFRSELSNRAADQAVAHADRLPGHERLLLDAHQAYRRGHAETARAQLEELTRLYPDDAEGWYKLGEVLLHFGAVNGWSLEEARDPFLRAAQLSALEAEVSYHLAQIGVAAGDTAAAIRSIDASLRAAPEGARAPQLRLLRAGLDPSSGEWEEAVADLDSGLDFTLISAMYNTAVYAGQPGKAAEIAELAAAEGRDTNTRITAHLLAAALEATRGRWSVARDWTERLRVLDPTAAEAAVALLAASPAIEAQAVDLRSLAEGLGPVEGPEAAGRRPWDDGRRYRLETRLYAEGLLAIVTGSTERLTTVTERLRTWSEDPAVGDALAGGLDLMAAARRGAAPAGAPPVAPVAAEDLILSPILAQPGMRYWHARSLERAGRPTEALDWYATLSRFSIHDLPWAVPALLDRARLHEELGQPASAASLYHLYLEWRVESEGQDRGADVARAGLERLGASREPDPGSEPSEVPEAGGD